MNELHLNKYKGQTKLTRANIRYKINYVSMDTHIRV